MTGFIFLNVEPVADNAAGCLCGVRRGEAFGKYEDFTCHAARRVAKRLRRQSKMTSFHLPPNSKPVALAYFMRSLIVFVLVLGLYPTYQHYIYIL